MEKVCVQARQGAIVTRWLPIFSLALACAAARGQDLDIVPGDHIGKVKLGARQTEVRRILGKPSRSMPSHGGRSLESWVLASGQGFEAVYEGGRVVQLKTSSGSFHFGKKSMPL